MMLSDFIERFYWLLKLEFDIDETLFYPVCVISLYNLHAF